MQAGVDIGWLEVCQQTLVQRDFSHCLWLNPGVKEVQVPDAGDWSLCNSQDLLNKPLPCAVSFPEEVKPFYYKFDIKEHKTVVSKKGRKILLQSKGFWACLRFILFCFIQLGHWWCFPTGIPVFLDIFPDKMSAIFAGKLEFSWHSLKINHAFVRSSFCYASKLTVKVSVH